jgi:predicted component of type VI protein secretion system
MKNTPSGRSVDHTERIRQQCEKRAKLWQEYVASYQKVLQESPETFSAFCSEFRERYLRVSLNH